jgi:hypothetical protein
LKRGLRKKDKAKKKAMKLLSHIFGFSLYLNKPFPSQKEGKILSFN